MFCIFYFMEIKIIKYRKFKKKIFNYFMKLKIAQYDRNRITINNLKSCQKDEFAEKNATTKKKFQQLNDKTSSFSLHSIDSYQICLTCARK